MTIIANRIWPSELLELKLSWTSLWPYCHEYSIPVYSMTNLSSSPLYPPWQQPQNQLILLTIVWVLHIACMSTLAYRSHRSYFLIYSLYFFVYASKNETFFSIAVRVIKPQKQNVFFFIVLAQANARKVSTPLPNLDFVMKYDRS